MKLGVAGVVVSLLLGLGLLMFPGCGARSDDRIVVTQDENRCARSHGSCTQDSDCWAGGCSGDLCTSTEGRLSGCDCGGSVVNTCGCVDGQCAWFRQGQ